MSVETAPPRPRSRGHVALATALGATGVLAALFFVLSPGIYLGDDAFISLTYARHLAEGTGLVFNPGERIWGFTSPLQTLLLAGFLALGVDAIRFAAALGVLEITAALILLVHITRAGTGTLGALAMLAVFCSLRVHLFPGLEGSLLVLLQVAALWLNHQRRFGLSAVVAGLSCLARPDSVLLFAPLLPFFSRPRRAVALFLLPGALWLAFSLAYYGAWLPNTLGAKTGITGFATFFGESWRWLTDHPFALAPSPWWLRAGLLAANLSLLLQAWCRRERALTYALVVYPWVLVTGYALIGPPHYYRWEIYSAHFFFTAGWALGLAGLLWQAAQRGLRGTALKRWREAIVGIAFCLAAAAGMTRYWKLYADMQSGYVVGARFETYRHIARWIEANVEGGVSLAHYEVGTLGFFARRMRLVDTGGLVSRRTADLHGQDLVEHMILTHRPTHLLRDNGEEQVELGGVRYRRQHVFPALGYLRLSLYARADP